MCHNTCYMAMSVQMDDAAPCRLALTTTWSGDLWGLRKELIPWLTYHSYLGVSRLYVLYEGTDMRTLRVRELQEHIHIHIHTLLVLV